MIPSSTVQIWPPPHQIKKNKRAKHVKLHASKEKGLEIIVPTYFNLKEIPFILEENKAWITDKLRHMLNQPHIPLPQEIILHAMNEKWAIEYMECKKKFEMIFRPQQGLQHGMVLIGQVKDMHFCKRQLIAWLKEKASDYLTTQLTSLSEQLNLNFKTLSIRDQKSRWGSCSSKKSINLNYKLIFLPYPLVKHVLIHELCHLKYLNHSDNFWNLVAKHDPDWQENRQALRKANQHIPAWI